VWDEIAIGLEEEGFLVRGEDKRVTCNKTKWKTFAVPQDSTRFLPMEMRR
jgi:hypothetical protein